MQKAYQGACQEVWNIAESLCRTYVTSKDVPAKALLDAVYSALQKPFTDELVHAMSLVSAHVAFDGSIPLCFDGIMAHAGDGRAFFGLRARFVASLIDDLVGAKDGPLHVGPNVSADIPWRKGAARLANNF
eukprot:741300-Alexandrium_andersonii.AAC.1